MFTELYIKDNKKRFFEGEIRAKDLSDYLDNLKLPKKVWIAEDATGIIQKIEYDPTTNQLIGLVLPLHKESGIPIPFTFMASSEDAIKQNIESPLSTLVYVILAQPIKENTPPFLLQMYGTDNKFTAESVVRRWRQTEYELKR